MYIVTVATFFIKLVIFKDTNKKHEFSSGNEFKNYHDSQYFTMFGRFPKLPRLGAVIPPPPPKNGVFQFFEISVKKRTLRK